MFDVFETIAGPIYRWKSFWFGVIALCFLGWAWVRSMSHYATMGVGIADNIWDFEITDGYLEIERKSAEGAFGWVPVFQIDSGESGAGERQWFPPVIQRFNRGLKRREEFVEDTAVNALDPFANQDPEVARADREELAALQIEVSDYMTWRIAWWFFMLIFSMAWVLFLAWRWRRVRELRQAS